MQACAGDQGVFARKIFAIPKHYGEKNGRLHLGEKMKRKKIIIASVLAICILAIGLGVYFGVRAYEKNKINFVLNDTLPDGNGKAATVIILAGQSNASGCSRDDYLQKNVSEEKYAEYQNGYDNVYINFAVSGYHFSEGFVPCKTEQGEGGGFFGPELGMAERLHEEYPDETFFIIKYAWGGTNLYEQWHSPSGGKKGANYREFEAFVNKSLAYLTSKNYDIKIEGMCWMQGESDSFSVENGTDYEENLSNFISDVRKEFSLYADGDGIAFVDAYIADNPVFWVYCDLVNESKRRVAASSPMNAIVDTIAHGLITTEEPEENPDIPHYDSLSELKLGWLFIDELSRFME